MKMLLYLLTEQLSTGLLFCNLAKGLNLFLVSILSSEFIVTQLSVTLLSCVCVIVPLVSNMHIAD